jgi:hypothetical protein
MIPPRNLALLSNRLARQGGRRIPEAVLERDYILAWFLIGLARTPLRNWLAFKGGTALKRCYFGEYRFSEDLDFTLRADVPFEVIRQGLEPVFAEVGRVIESKLMARKEEPLKLGKGVAFVKAQLKRLPQEDDTWEADFRALPKPSTRSVTNYVGIVLTQPDGDWIAEEEVEGTPTVNDLANLLARAMQRPIVECEGRHRPRCIRVRGHHQWRELFPHLEELGIKVVVSPALPKIEHAFKDVLKEAMKAQRAKRVKPTAEQQSVEKMFPAIAQWVRDGHIEIGNQEGFGFVVRALDYGGQAFEDDKPATLAEALASLEQGIRKWYKEQGIDLEG